LPLCLQQELHLLLQLRWLQQSQRLLQALQELLLLLCGGGLLLVSLCVLQGLQGCSNLWQEGQGLGFRLWLPLPLLLLLLLLGLQCTLLLPQHMRDCVRYLPH
jgi:hypothetical protein